MPYDYIEEYQKQDDETIWEFRDKNAQAKIDTSSTETDYANPLSLETMQAQLAKNTKIKLDPIQDLHGYDKPWTGGAGKNKLRMILSDIKTSSFAGTWNENVYTHNNVAFTVNMDSDSNIISIKVNGTNNGSDNAALRFAQRTFDPQHLPAGNYIINSGVNTGDNNIMFVCGRTYNGGWQELARSSGSDANLLVNEGDDLGFSIEISPNRTVNNMIFYPTVRLATESDSTFEPYTNVSSISGHDQIDILGCGKNLLTAIDVAPGTQGGITFAVNDDPEIILSGTYSSTVYRRLIKDYTLKLEPGSTYTLSGAYSGQQLRLREWDVNDNLLATNLCNSSTPLTFTVNTNTDHVDVYLIIYSLSNTVIKPQLEKNSSQTDWEPYQESNNKTLDLPQTVYGGILDLESGELVVNHGAVDLGSLTWDTALDNNHYRHGTQVPNSIQNVVGGNSDVISSQYMKFTGSSRIWDNLGTGYFTLNNSYVWGSRLVIKDDRYTDATSFKTGVTGQTICYKLATSFTLYISPEHLKLLKAQNNLTTSQYTQIKVTYRNGVFATLEELSDTAQDIYDEISGDSTTISGNPINFTTREKQKSKSTIIDLEPIQDFHGYSKPWVGGAGKNLLILDLDHMISSNVGSGSWSNNVFTINNVTFTILFDNDNNIVGIKVNGTANANTAFSFLKNGVTDYILYAGKQVTINGGTSAIKFQYWSTSASYVDSGSGASFTFPSTKPDNWNVSLYITSGTAISNVIIKPMLCLSTVTDATFEPYTNICSISGRTSVDINGCGKNLLPKSTLNGTIDGVTFTVNDDGSITANGTASALVIYNITLCYWKTFLKAGTYILSGVTGGSNSTYDMRIMIDASQYPAELFNGDLVFTLDKDTQVSPRIIIRNGYKAENLKFYPMIRSASNTNGEFKSYTPSTDLTISFGTTVYGGRLDVEKGELVISYIDKIDLGDYTWTMYSSGSAAYFDAIHNLSNIKNYGYGVCDCYELSQASTVDGMKNGQIRFNSNKFYIKDLTKASATELQNSLSGKYATCELETPQTIQLTPQQVQLLKGINNISTTGTTITVTFKNGSVAHLDDLPDFTDLDKEKLASIDTLAITLDLLTHTLIVTQDI